MKQFTREQAIAFGENKLYESLSDREKVSLQLFQRKLCMPFDVFHEAIENVLGRPVWTHEFAFIENLQKEFLGEKEPPTMDEIMALLPNDKIILIGL